MSNTVLVYEKKHDNFLRRNLRLLFSHSVLQPKRTAPMGSMMHAHVFIWLTDLKGWGKWTYSSTTTWQSLWSWKGKANSCRPVSHAWHSYDSKAGTGKLLLLVFILSSTLQKLLQGWHSIFLGEPLKWNSNNALPYSWWLKKKKAIQASGKYLSLIIPSSCGVTLVISCVASLFASSFVVQKRVFRLWSVTSRWHASYFIQTWRLSNKISPCRKQKLYVTEE